MLLNQHTGQGSEYLKHPMIMKKIISALFVLAISATSLFGQKEEEEVEKGFKKEYLFTGGSVSLAFYNNTFLIGASPVFGYSFTKWAEAGIVINYNYTAYRDILLFDDKLHQTMYGGGSFVKLYPIRFLFATAQYEHNFLRQKYIPPNNGISSTSRDEANSFLIGGGYTTGRFSRGGGPFYYLAVLFDVLGKVNSPYTDAYGRTIPIIRGGLQLPLFQGSGNGGGR
jgi:hypothetical protein